MKEMYIQTCDLDVTLRTRKCNIESKNGVGSSKAYMCICITKLQLLKQLVCVMLIAFPLAGYSGETWQREDRLASKIKEIKNAEDLITAIKRCESDAYWSKARIAFSWISANIKYDWTKFRKGGKACTPDETISKRRGVCSDYSLLFETILEALGYESRIITGYAKGHGYVPGDKVYLNHAWNAIKGPKDEWHLFDVTWGEFYYDLAPEIMIYDHLPTQSDWQLLDHPISKNEYEKMRLLPRFYLEAGISIDLLRKDCPDGICDAAAIYKVPQKYRFVAKEIPVVKKLKIGHRYTIVIDAPRNRQFWIKNGFRTKSFGYEKGKHVVTFIPVRPRSSAQLMVGTKRTRWTVMKWSM